jgi:hypothetical protein
LRQEIAVLSVPIQAGCQAVAGSNDVSAPEIMQATLRSIAGYFVRMAGAMNEPTNAFWLAIAGFFESQFGVFPVAGDFDADYFAQMLEPDKPSELFGAGAVDLKVLNGVRQYDRENNSEYFGRTRMLLWRFAEAFVAADLEGTIDEEAALDEFRKILDAETDSA